MVVALSAGFAAGVELEVQVTVLTAEAKCIHADMISQCARVRRFRSPHAQVQHSDGGDTDKLAAA